MTAYYSSPIVERRRSSLLSNDSLESGSSYQSCDSIGSSASSIARRERQNALTLQQAEEVATYLLYVERRNSERTLALLRPPANIEQHDDDDEGGETLEEKCVRLEEENELLKSKLGQMLERMGGRLD